MGALFSSKRVSHQDMAVLRENFLSLSKKITRVLPLIGLLRNGAAALLLVATGFMFAAISTQMWPPGGTVAGILLILAFISHLTTFVLRERKIAKTCQLLNEFYKVMDQPNELKGEKWMYLLLFLVEVFSLFVGFLSPEQEVSVLVIFTFLAMAFTAVVLIWKILKGMDDFVWVNTCQKRAKSLHKLMAMQAENGTDTRVNISER